MFHLPIGLKRCPVTGADAAGGQPAVEGDPDGGTGAARLPAPEPSASEHDPARDPDSVAEEADRFLQEYYTENPRAGELSSRLREVRAAIAATGTYEHTFEELEYGVRVAWRNSNRCIGRLYWQSLRLRDRRSVRSPEEIGAECVEHLRAATNGGKIRPMITVFAPDRPDAPAARLRNEQLVRYAGYRTDSGGVLGDPRTIGFTDAVRALGWSGPGTAFDVLPLLIEADGSPPYLHELPADEVMEVPLSHPDQPWFAELGLRWHAVPAVADMCLEVGGVHYPCAPFNGWYMGTEIGSRNLADPDRYDLLPTMAAGLGLDTSNDRTLWKDRALVELNLAVLHSYEESGVTIADHHTESVRFLKHLAKEENAGRVCPADWSWIVPPLSSGSTPVYHRYYEDADLRPNFVRHEK